MVINAGRSLGVLNALKFKLDRATLEQLYHSFVRSKLEYGSIVWDNCTNDLSNIIEQVQYRAGKIVSGAIARTRSEFVFKELGWESLADRRRNQRLKTMYKIVNKEAPKYLQESLPKPEARPYNLRNENNIPQL